MSLAADCFVARGAQPRAAVQGPGNHLVLHCSQTVWMAAPLLLPPAGAPRRALLTHCPAHAAAAACGYSRVVSTLK